MKYRNGFVSNSSTTSFCIYGVQFEDSEFIEAVKDAELIKNILANTECETLEEAYEVDKYELMENLLEGVGVGYYNDSECGRVYIGDSLSDCKDDQTMGDFKQKVRENITKVLNVKDYSFEVIEETISS